MGFTLYILYKLLGLFKYPSNDLLQLEIAD